MAQKTGCKGEYALRRAPHHDRLMSTPVEPMQLIKNIAEHVVCLLSGREDSVKVRKQEEQYGRFPTSWVKGTSTLPKAPFTLSKDQISIADRRAMSVHVPNGFDWRPRAIFGSPGGMKMKSHEWKQVVTSGVLICYPPNNSTQCLNFLTSSENSALNVSIVVVLKS